MRRSLLVGLVFLALVPLDATGCWLTQLKPGTTHCWDAVDKTRHTVGSSWTNSKCEMCQCRHAFQSCCAGMPTIGNYANDCTVKYNYTACTYKVFKKSNPKMLCSHRAAYK